MGSVIATASTELSMRQFSQELGVDPMALYRHVRDKDDLLAGAARS